MPSTSAALMDLRHDFEWEMTKLLEKYQAKITREGQPAVIVDQWAARALHADLSRNHAGGRGKNVTQRKSKKSVCRTAKGKFKRC